MTANALNRELMLSFRQVVEGDGNLNREAIIERDDYLLIPGEAKSNPAFCIEFII